MGDIPTTSTQQPHQTNPPDKTNTTIGCGRASTATLLGVHAFGVHHHFQRLVITFVEVIRYVAIRICIRIGFDAGVTRYRRIRAIAQDEQLTVYALW